MPGSTSAGRPEKKASKAASPPAEAPMPTIEKFVSGGPFGCAVGSIEIIGSTSIA